MRVDIKSDTERKQYLSALDSYIKKNNMEECSLFVQLGSKVVRIICYSSDFIPHIEKQLTYTLREPTDNFEATLIVWNETDFPALHDSFSSANPHLKMKERIQQLVAKKYNAINKDPIVFLFMDNDYSLHDPLIFGDEVNGIIRAINNETNTYYYGIKNLEPEEFIKHGHIFVQQFNKIVKTDTAGLVHGALVGVNNRGVLICAYGNKGKSTLSILSMLNGMDYVSDDYLILEKEGDKLYSYPIYSIVTLTPFMYNKLYSEFQGKFISNNARKNKYVFNIENYHNKFCTKYPVEICLLPEIVGGDTPTIVECNKGRPITQLVNSTIRQMGDRHDIRTVQKLMGFVKNFKFYQLNLSDDIRANVKCFKEFCENL